MRQLRLATFWLFFFATTTVPFVTGYQTESMAAMPGSQEQGGREGGGQDDKDKIKSEDDDKSIREKTIYIPFEKLRDVFEKDNRKVVLSYEEFNKLWKAARANTTVPPVSEARRGAIISQADSVASIGETVVSVVADLKIELLSSGWSEVPLGLTNSAIKSGKVGDQEARIIFDPKSGYKLLVRNETDKPKSIELKLEYAKAFQKSPGQSSVSFQAPKAPVNRWRVRIPQPQVKIDVEPLIAVTNLGEKNALAAGANEKVDPTKETVVLAFLGAAPQVSVKWNPKSEGASGLDAIVSAETVQQVSVDKNVQRTQFQVKYEISRAELSGLRLEVPADQKVTNVFNENVKKWNVEKQGARQIVNIELFSAIKGVHSLTVELEKLTEEALKQDYSAALIKVLDASRQQGIVVLQLSDGLRSVSKNRLGLLQLDKSELPAQLARGNWSLAFRYAALPYQLELSIEKIMPRILAQQLTEIDLSPRKIQASTDLVYDVQQAGIFSTDLKIPEGYNVRSIVGATRQKGVNAIPVTEFRQDEKEPTLWHVDFARKAAGKIGLRIEIEKELADQNLLTPTGNSSQLELPFTVAADSQLEFSEGSLVVYGPESLRINPEREQGLQQVTVAKAMEKVPARGSRLSQARPVLSYSYSGDESALTVNVLRRKPRVTTRQLLTAKIESGVIKYDAKLYYEILYSGVKSIRIDLPDSIANNVRNVTPGITETEIENAPNLADGYVAWGFSGEAEWFGQKTIHLTWDVKIDELEIGKSVDIDLPRLIPQGVDRAEGQIVASKAETIDIQPREGIEGLVPIDPKVDLMPEAKITDAAAAFEFVDEWKLPIRATRYDVEDVKLTNVEAGLVQIVKLRQEGLSVRALFRIRSAVQRLGMKLPPGVNPADAFDSQPVRINGNPINLELGNGDELFVPLTGIQTDEPFLLDLRYKVKAEEARLLLPKFSDDPAMQKVHLCIYIPQELSVIGSKGPWTNELLKDKTPGQILWEGTFNEYYSEKLIRQRVEEIRNDIAKGVSSVAVAPEFKTDGRSFLFSALRPDPEQELSILAISRWWINSLLIAGVIAVGLPLYRRPLTWQLGILFLLIAAVVLTGVFFPMLGRQLISSVLFISIGLLILVWAIGHVTNLTVGLKSIWSSVSASQQVDRDAGGPVDDAGGREPAGNGEDSGDDSQPAQDASNEGVAGNPPGDDGGDQSNNNPSNAQ